MLYVVFRNGSTIVDHTVFFKVVLTAAAKASTTKQLIQATTGEPFTYNGTVLSVQDLKVNNVSGRGSENGITSSNNMNKIHVTS